MGPLQQALLVIFVQHKARAVCTTDLDFSSEFT